MTSPCCWRSSPPSSPPMPVLPPAGWPAPWARRHRAARNLERMRLFYLEWRISQTVSAKSAESQPAVFRLPWSHYVRLLSIREPEARAFYEAEAFRNGWTIRHLDRQIATQFYERT